MKKYFIGIMIFLQFGILNAQNFKITGNVLDKTEKISLQGVSITVTKDNDPKISGTLTDYKGKFEIKNLSTGEYKLRFSYIGYQEVIKHITIKDRNIELGNIFMEEKPTQTDEVEITADMPAVELKGDTTQYNAGAYKANPDAVAEDLVQKMPGIVVQNNKVQAQGEDVKKVLMDGKPFFGEDPTAALKSIPADIIDKVQIFDEKSEQAQFTGFDDGETQKTMNIVTHVNMRTGQFGKAYAGYGDQDKYQAGTSFNIFDDDRRISILAQANNVNQQNFAIEDILGAVSSFRGGRMPFMGRGPGSGMRRSGSSSGGGTPGFGGGSVRDFLVNQQNGISTTNALGVNYSDQWGEDIKLTGSYFINHSKNDAMEDIAREYISLSDTTIFYNEEDRSNSKNINHRFNLRFDWDIDSSNSILIRPRVSFQQNEGSSLTIAGTENQFRPINISNNDFNSDLSGYDLSNQLLYRHKFSLEGRTISINFNTGYNSNDGENTLEATSISYPFNFDTLNQMSELDMKGSNLSYSLAYTEPLWDNSQLQLDYGGHYNNNKSDKSTYKYDEVNESYSNLDTTLTNIFNSNYISQDAGLSYRYNKDNSNFTAGASYQWSNLNNLQDFPFENETEKSFNNILPYMRYQYRFSRRQHFRIFYRTNTDLPRIEQLQNVIDNSNPLQLSTGNLNLKESYQHSLFLNYMSVDVRNASNFFVMIGGRYSNNYIGDNTLTFNQDTILDNQYSVSNGTQITLPENFDNYWDLRSFVNYGMPISFIKCNMNINIAYRYNNIPGMLDNLLNYSRSQTISTGLALSSNISESVDFTLSSFSNFNTVNNSINKDVNITYFNQNTNFRMNLIFFEHLVIRSDLSHNYYSGLSDDYNTNYFLWNAVLGYKFLENKQAEINISAFDILNQNKAITRNVNDIYIEDSKSNVLQRYFMLTFVYTFRNFGIE
jgi:hypothetical protein